MLLPSAGQTPVPAAVSPSRQILPACGRRPDVPRLVLMQRVDTHSKRLIVALAGYWDRRLAPVVASHCRNPQGSGHSQLANSENSSRATPFTSPDTSGIDPFWQRARRFAQKIPFLGDSGKLAL